MSYRFPRGGILYRWLRRTDRKYELWAAAPGRLISWTLELRKQRPSCQLGRSGVEHSSDFGKRRYSGMGAQTGAAFSSTGSPCSSVWPVNVRVYGAGMRLVLYSARIA